MSGMKDLIAEINKRSKSEIASMGIIKEDPVRVPTGIFALDLAIGGGFPVGRIGVVYGTESSMKTTLCLKIIAQAQKMWPKKKCVFFDVEGHLVTSWAKTIGVDTDNLVYVMPTNAEQLVDTIESVLYADDVSVVVVDSIAAIVTQHELDSEAEKAMVGTQGILVNKLYRKLGRALSVADVEKRTPLVLLINQIRMKVGVMYGDPETMPGGQSFKYGSSLTLRLNGKDEFDKELSETLPAFKKVGVIVKKWKVPITARNSEFTIALRQHPTLGLEIGDTLEKETINHYLKSLEFLRKDTDGAGWVLCNDTGEILVKGKTQKEIDAAMKNDEKLMAEVKAAIVRAVFARGDELGGD